MKLKLLLYCTKAKPYLYKTDDTMIEKMDGDYHTQLNKAVLNDNCLTGKIGHYYTNKDINLHLEFRRKKDYIFNYA